MFDQFLLKTTDSLLGFFPSKDDVMKYEMFESPNEVTFLFYFQQKLLVLFIS